MRTSPHSIILAPSLLAGDHSNLGESLRIVEASGAKWVHLDIMDGHFVPNLSFGPQTVAALRPQSSLFFDVHLMLENPDQHLDAFLKAGADQVSIHLEPNYPVEATIQRIKQAGIKCGIVLNPDTPAEAAIPYLSLCDMIVLMTVVPGFGGQAFREDVLPKMQRLAQWRKEEGHAYRIQVDGGITIENAPDCVACGVDVLVAGTAFFKASDPQKFAADIQNQ